MVGMDMDTSVIETVKSLSNLYTYLDEDIIRQVSGLARSDQDIVRTVQGLRLAKRALSTALIDPIEYRSLDNGEVTADCDDLKNQVDALINLPPALQVNSREQEEFRLQAISAYAAAAKMAFLLSREKANPFR